MKRLNLAFGIITLIVIVCGLIHSGVAWIVAETTWDPYTTSFPTWGAFVLPIICYGVITMIVLIAWLIAFLALRGIDKSRSK